jgi:putative nucleotidyltransferase with HDIG domain
MMYLINFESKKTFTAGDMRLLTSLAEQISMVITNSELYSNLKNFLFNVIKTLVHAIEAKDSYTRGHSERVNTLVITIAEAMDLSPVDQEALSRAAILHDIGKIGISEKILNKPGKLTQEEFLRIQEHPEKGYTILKPIEQLNESLSAIRHHHERYDGTGYPSGLKGEEIPLYARIIALADTYDAMTSARSYRPNISYEDAVAEIVSVQGTQLDPELVQIFLKCLNDSFLFTV